MSKNAVLQMMVEGAVEEIMLKSGAANVIVNAANGETLATRLAGIAADIAARATPADVQTSVNNAIDNLINGAPGTYDTLKEIADYIESDQTAAAAMNTAIAGKVDKVSGKGLSANDLTDALLAKLNSVAEGAAKVEASATNGNIKINGAETSVYAHPSTAGNKHIPSGGTAGQVLKYGGASGTAAWGDVSAVIRYGVSTPADLGVNELFIKILE